MDDNSAFHSASEPLLEAIQRAGRANRMGPGKTIRLWTQAEALGLVESDAPGILRDNLDSLYLDTLAWGALPESLKWLTPPEVGALKACRERLVAIGAVNKSGLTSAGRRWQRSSYGPKLSKVLEQMGELSDEEFKPLLWLLPLLDGESVPGKPHEHLLEKIQNLPPRHRYRESVRRFSKRLNRPLPATPTSLNSKRALSLPYSRDFPSACPKTFFNDASVQAPEWHRRSPFGQPRFSELDIYLRFQPRWH